MNSYMVLPRSVLRSEKLTLLTPPARAFEKTPVSAGTTSNLRQAAEGTAASCMGSVFRPWFEMRRGLNIMGSSVLQGIDGQQRVGMVT